MVSGAANGGVRVWDVVSGECLQHLRGHVKSVTAVTCTAEHLLSVSLESVLCIWDRARGECMHRLKQVSKVVAHGKHKHHRKQGFKAKISVRPGQARENT